jgi:hypothetical protein
VNERWRSVGSHIARSFAHHLLFPQIFKQGIFPEVHCSSSSTAHLVSDRGIPTARSSGPFTRNIVQFSRRSVAQDPILCGTTPRNARDVTTFFAFCWFAYSVARFVFKQALAPSRFSMATTDRADKDLTDLTWLTSLQSMCAALPHAKRPAAPASALLKVNARLALTERSRSVPGRMVEGEPSSPTLPPTPESAPVDMETLKQDLEYVRVLFIACQILCLFWRRLLTPNAQIPL